MQNVGTRNLLGIDINEYTQGVNLDRLRQRANFLYLRAAGYGTGALRVDRSFLKYALEARQKNIPVGAYLFAVPSSNLETADEQCNGFIETLQEGFGEKDYGDLFPVVDVETPLDNSISTEDLVAWIDRFRTCFESKTNRKLMLYTGEFFVKMYDDFFVPGEGYPLSNMPLWIAKYEEINGKGNPPDDVGGWDRWRVWQYTEIGNIPGANPPLDLNYGPESLDYLRPPKQVQDFKATINMQNINATWKKNTDKDLAGYNIFVNGNYVNTLGKDENSITFSLNDFPDITEPISIGIEAFDRDGDVSKRTFATPATIEVRTRDFSIGSGESKVFFSYPENYLE